MPLQTQVTSTKPFNPGNLIQGINKIESSDAFKKLKPEEQKQVKGLVYDKIVTKWYKKIGTPVDKIPSKEEYLKGSPVKILGPGVGLTQASLSKTITGIEKTALKVDEGIAQAFDRVFFSTPTGHAVGIHEYFKSGYDAAQDIESTTAEYQADKYAKASVTKKAIALGAEFLPQLVLFAGAGKIADVGIGATANPATILKYKKIYDLIRNFSIGYLGSLGLGSSSKEAIRTGGMFAALPYIGKVPGKFGVYKKGFGAPYMSPQEIMSFTKAYVSKLLGIGGPTVLQRVLEHADLAVRVGLRQAARGGNIPKMSDPIVQAGLNILDTFSKQKYGKVYQLLPKFNKLAVQEAVAGMAKEVDTKLPAVDKNIIVKEVADGLTKNVKTSPEFSSTAEILFGKDWTKKVFNDTVEMAQENAGIKTGVKGISKSLNRLGKGITKESEFIERDLDVVNRLSPGPGATSINDVAFTNKLYSSSTIRNNYKLESKEDRLIQLWDNRDAFKSKTVKSIINDEMKKVFPNINPRDYNKMVKILDDKLSDVATLVREKTPGGVKHGARVFASHTRLPGEEPTKFGKQLETEAEMARIEKGISNKQAKAAVKSAKKVLRQHDLNIKEE